MDGYGGLVLKHGGYYYGHTMAPVLDGDYCIYHKTAFFSKNQVFWGKCCCWVVVCFIHIDSHFEEHIFSIETKTKLDHGLVKCCLVGIYPPPTHR